MKLCAHCASRVFEALSPYCPSVPNPRAALRLPGVREGPPLRGYCGAQSLATFERVWVYALCASRVFEALSPYCPSVPNPRAALRLPGVREGPPLRGYCGAQSLATFERVWVCALRASRVFEALSPYCPSSLIPRLRYACPGLERGRLFEAVAAHSPWRPLRGCGYTHSVLRTSSRR